MFFLIVELVLLRHQPFDVAQNRMVSRFFSLLVHGIGLQNRTLVLPPFNPSKARRLNPPFSTPKVEFFIPNVFSKFELAT